MTALTQDAAALCSLSELSETRLRKRAHRAHADACLHARAYEAAAMQSLMAGNIEQAVVSLSQLTSSPAALMVAAQLCLMHLSAVSDGPDGTHGGSGQGSDSDPCTSVELVRFGISACTKACLAAVKQGQLLPGYLTNPATSSTPSLARPLKTLLTLLIRRAETQQVATATTAEASGLLCCISLSLLLAKLLWSSLQARTKTYAQAATCGSAGATTADHSSARPEIQAHTQAAVQTVLVPCLAEAGWLSTDLDTEAGSARISSGSSGSAALSLAGLVDAVSEAWQESCIALLQGQGWSSDSPLHSGPAGNTPGGIALRWAPSLEAGAQQLRNVAESRLPAADSSQRGCLLIVMASCDLVRAVSVTLLRDPQGGGGGHASKLAQAAVNSLQQALELVPAEMFTAKAAMVPPGAGLIVPLADATKNKPAPVPEVVAGSELVSDAAEPTVSLSGMEAPPRAELSTSPQPSGTGDGGEPHEDKRQLKYCAADLLAMRLQVDSARRDALLHALVDAGCSALLAEAIS